VSWNILVLVLRIEWETIGPELERIHEHLRMLHDDVVTALEKIETLQVKIEPLLQRVLELKNDTAPLWEDTYSLCGNPRCHGTCTVCQEGEEDYVDDYEEKYCRRGRR
jgi:hypothetical protein